MQRGIGGLVQIGYHEPACRVLDCWIVPEAATIRSRLQVEVNRSSPNDSDEGSRSATARLHAARRGIGENRNTARNQARRHVAMLQVVRGATIAATHGRDGLASNAFGARLFTGVVRKKPGLNLVSERTERPSLPHQGWQGFTGYRRGSGVTQAA